MQNSTGGAAESARKTAALHYVRIPKVGNRPTKGPVLAGWNLPASEANPNGYTADQGAADGWLRAGDNIGLALVPSKIVSLDLDDIDQAKRIFTELGLPLASWLEDPARLEIQSGKPGKGKLLFRVEADAPVSRKLEFGAGKGRKSIFELRHGSRDGTTLQDVLPPSIHPDTGKPYDLIGDLTRIPPIPDELLRLWREWPADLLKAFDPDHVPPQPAARPKAAQAVPGQRDPIAEFNAAHDLESILQANGYTRKGRRWLRPGSDSGLPGLVVFDGSDGKLCYSHGADELNDGAAHDAFDVFRILQCAGDWKTALAWNPDLTRENQKSYRQGQTDQGNEANQETSESEWREPIPISSTLTPVKAFDARLLPEAFRDWVMDLSRVMQCPPDYAAVGAMVCLSSVVGRKLGIRPKARADWLVVCNLWGAVIGPPSTLKTPTIEAATAPCKRLEIAAKEAYQAAEREHKAGVMLQEITKESAKAKIKELVKKGLTDAAKAAAMDACEETPPPIRRRFVVNDATTEKLGELLNQNPNGLLLLRDELTGWLANMEREDRAADRAFYLECFNGSGRFTYDRIVRGTLDIESLTLAIFGGIQPAKLAPIVRNAVKGGTQDDGLLQRFQLAVYPDFDAPFTYIDEWPNADAKNKAFAVFERLAAWAPVGDDDIPTTRFHPAAQGIFVEWLTELERSLRSDDLHPALVAHLAKFRSLAPSLALLLHLADLEHLPNRATDEALQISEQAMIKAAAWCEYLRSHAERIYGLATNATATNAANLTKRIRKGQLDDGFTVRDVVRKGWAGLSERAEVEEALLELVDHGWIRERQIQTTERGGRPSAAYVINPAARGDGRV